MKILLRRDQRQGAYNSAKIDISAAWQWLIPNPIPTRSWMLEAFIANVSYADTRAHQIDKFLYRLTFALSGFYLLILLIIVMLLGFLLIR